MIALLVKLFESAHQVCMGSLRTRPTFCVCGLQSAAVSVEKMNQLVADLKKASPDMQLNLIQVTRVFWNSV